MDRSKWEYKKLGEVATFINGDRGVNYPSQTDFVEVGIPFVNAGHLTNNKIDFSSMNYIKREKYDKLGSGKIRKGDILFCLRGSLGKKAIVDNLEEGAIASSLVIIRPSKIDTNFLSYYLESPSIKREILRSNNGSSQPNLSAKSVSQFVVTVPQIADQKRIVAELDCLNEMIAVKQEQLKEFDKLAQSIFYDMFGDPLENAHGWHCDILANLVSEDCSISYGIVQPGDDVEDGVPVVRPVDLTSSVVYRKGLKVVDKAISDSYKRTILNGNELLFCVRGTTGIMSFASEELKGCNVTRGITPLSFSEKVDRTYIYYLLATPYLQSIIAEKTNGIALKQINMRDVRQLPILLPPLSLQQQFAEKISAIEAQKELVKQSIAETQQLFNSKMDYYFND